MGKSIQNSTRELANLEFLSGQLETMDEFAQVYESMLEEAKAIEDKDRRQARARALQTIMLKQAEFLLNQYLREKRATKDPLATLNGYPAGSMN